MSEPVNDRRPSQYQVRLDAADLAVRSMIPLDSDADKDTVARWLTVLATLIVQFTNHIDRSAPARSDEATS